jgi:hypothetical protein
MSLADRLLSEGLTTWMYLDTADKPVVTSGVGHAIFTLEDCLALPWNQPEAVVRKDYVTISAKPKGYKASWYAQFTTSRLAESFVREQEQRDTDREVKILRGQFPRYKQYPEPVQEALADMAFQLGGSFPKHWPQLSQAVRNEDWARAALCCHRKGASDERNRETAQLFLKAANEELPPAA